MIKYSTIFIWLFFFFQCSSVSNIPLNQCKKISGMPGNEDLSIDLSTGVLYVSSHERRIKDMNGKLFQIPLNTDGKIPEEIKTNYPPNFKPHGMSLTTVNGKLLLYVISHPDTKEVQHTIEVFAKETEGWKHIQTLTNETLVSPNDLYAMPDGKIFVSNDRGGSLFMAFLELLFNLKRSKITYYDGTNWQLLDKEVAYGNGILVTKEGSDHYLYRAGFLENAIYKYKLSYTDNKPILEEVAKIKIDSGPDNIEQTEDGTMYVTGHPSISKFLSHFRNKENIAPGEVYNFTKDGDIKKVYANTGEEISAPSVALIYKDKIYIGQVFDDFILYCDKP